MSTRFGFISLLFIFFFSMGLIFSDDITSWKETRTRYCTFVYRAEDEAAAAELCGFADEVYETLSDYFDDPSERVRVVLVGNSDEANGLYSMLPHHLSLNLRAPVSPWLGARTENWLKQVFIHELAHYFDIASDRGFFWTLSRIFGASVRAVGAGFEPAWMVEGIATLMETELTDAGRGRNPFFLMYAKALLLDDIPFSLGHVEYNSAYPPPGRIYLFGYLFMDYLKGHYGIGIFQKIRRRFLEFPFAGPWQAIRYVTKRHQDDLWEDMRRELKEKFLLESETGEGVSFSPDLIADYYTPVPTERGYFFYRERLDRAPGIVFFDPATQLEAVIVETFLTDERSFAVSRDGTRLVYASLQYSGNGYLRGTSDSELYSLPIVYDTDGTPRGGARRTLTPAGHLWHPDFSPDGTQIVAVQAAGTYSRLVLVDPESGEVATLYDEAFADVYNPRFSPDASRVVFAVNRRGIQDIAVLSLPLDSRKPEVMRPLTLLTQDRAGDYFPRFIDDSTILFTSDRGGTLALYAFSLATNTLTRVVEDRIAAFNGLPVPGGLLYGTYRSSGYCVKFLAEDRFESEAVPLPAESVRIPEAFLRPDIDVVPYVDVLELYYWMPFGNLMRRGADWYVAPGIYLEYGSLLGTFRGDASLLYYPAFAQPEVTFNTVVQVGPVDLIYRFQHTYQVLGGPTDYLYRERFDQQLLAGFPITNRFADSYQEFFSLYTGFQHSWLLQKDQTFSFLNDFAPQLITDLSVLSAVAGFDYLNQKYSGPAAFYPPWSLVIGLDCAVPLPLWEDSPAGFTTKGLASWSVPGLWNLSSLKIGLKASYVTPELVGTPYVLPRGGFTPQAQAEPGRALASLDYQFTVFYSDAPLVAGLHIDGLGAGLHAEMFADFDPADGSLVADRHLYAGMEVTLMAGIGRLVLPLGVGVSFRFDLSEARPFDPREDWALYFFFSFDSFGDTFAATLH